MRSTAMAARDGVTGKTAFDRTGDALERLRAGLAEDRRPDSDWRQRLPGRCPICGSNAPARRPDQQARD